MLKVKKEFRGKYTIVNTFGLRGYIFHDYPQYTVTVLKRLKSIAVYTHDKEYYENSIPSVWAEGREIVRGRFA
jgi:hypothetical protein